MTRTLVILSLFLSAVSALAQEPSSLIRAEFRVFPVLNINTTGVLYRPAPDQQMVEIEFRPRARSFETYAYSGPPKLNFYREDGLNEDNEMQYRVVGQLDVDTRESLIFFAENPNSADESLEFALLGVDDSPRGLPVNHVSFLNFTRIPFACRFMDQNMMLQPGENEPISVEQKLEEDVLIGLAITNEVSHRVVLKSRWKFHPGNRHHILLLPPQREGSFRIRAYRITEFVGDNARFVGQ